MADQHSFSFETILLGVLTFIGWGGWGYKSMVHSQLLDQHAKDIEGLKGTREKDLDKLDNLALTMATMNGKLDTMLTEIATNRELYVRRRKQHIIDTGGEVEE